MAGFYSKLSILPLVAITPAADDGCVADTTAVDARRRTLSWIALSAVCVAWGSIHLAIRVGVGHLRPRFLAGTRHVIAGALSPGLCSISASFQVSCRPAESLHPLPKSAYQTKCWPGNYNGRQRTHLGSPRE
jgi:hypothetical protein